MFCRKCGHELMDTDIFCNKCGSKVETQFSTPVEDNDEHCTESKSENTAVPEKLSNGILKDIGNFFVCLVIYIFIVSMLYAIILPANISVVAFIKDPRGLAAVVGFAIGAAILPFLITVPILNGLTKVKVFERPHKIEILFIMMLLEIILEYVIGRKNIPYPLMSHFIVPIVLFVLLVFGKMKGK